MSEQNEWLQITDFLAPRNFPFDKQGKRAVFVVALRPSICSDSLMGWYPDE